MGIGKKKKKHASLDRKREKVDHHKITSMLMAVAAVVLIRWSVKGVADCIGMVGAKQESRIILLSGVKMIHCLRLGSCVTTDHREFYVHLK